MNKHWVCTVLLFFFVLAGTVALAGQARPRRAKAASTSAPASRTAQPEFPVPPMPSDWDGTFYNPLPNVEPNPARGIYAIWYSNTPELLDLPFLKGGQVMVQWADIEPGEGKYDFSPIDKQLEELAKRNFYTTLQVNGNNKPDWMFNKVPYYPDLKNFSKQVLDKQGALMYWHPACEKYYFDFLKALAEYMRTSKYRDRIVGLRMNFNSIGTEFVDIPPEAYTQKGWIIPPGVDPGPFPWKPSIGEEYMQKVVEEHIKDFTGVTRIFIRAYVGPEIKEKYAKDFDSGKLSWFFTGMAHVPIKWRMAYPSLFFDCRSGKTLGYGEPGSDAWGHRPESKGPKDIPPVSANYWRLLLDMHMGISCIACYGADLRVAYDGTLAGPPNPRAKQPVTAPAGKPIVDPVLKDEFYKSFEFSAKYAGYHASPTVSPGAWIALRQISKSDDRNSTWDVISNDCTFLMARLPDKTIPVKAIGPEEQRFSSYARKLPKNESMQLVLDPLFAKSMAGKKAGLNVTYFDGPKGSIKVEIKSTGQAFPIDLKNSGRWQTASFEIPQADFGEADEKPDIIVTAGPDEDVALHMIEVTRE